MLNATYKNGPVYERAVCVLTSIPEDTFLDRLERWKEIAASELPVTTKFADREISLPEEWEKQPVQKISIRHRFWSQDPKKEHADWCIQLSPDRFIVNLRRKDHNDQRGFAELKNFFDEWLNKWLNCFESPKINCVKLEYWNRINKDTVPDFANESYIEVKDIFSLFRSMPMPKRAKKYITPYQYEANWDAELEEKPYRLSASIRAVPSKIMTLQTHFLAECEIQNNSPVGELDQLHVLVHDLFDSVFTKEVKEIFK